VFTFRRKKKIKKNKRMKRRFGEGSIYYLFRGSKIRIRGRRRRERRS